MGFFGFFQNLRFCHTYDVNGMDNAIKILPKISPCGAHAKYKKTNRIYTQGLHMRASLANKKKIGTWFGGCKARALHIGDFPYVLEGGS